LLVVIFVFPGFAKPHPGLRYVVPARRDWPSPASARRTTASPLSSSRPDGQGRGVVLHVQRDYSDGPEGLALAIRRVDPSYDQSRDPDLRRTANPDPSPLTPDPSSCPMWALLISVILLLLRKFIPDLAVLAKKAATPIVAHIKNNTNEEMAKLREELTQLKQQNKPAAP
jgi:hypothetical protein